MWDYIYPYILMIHSTITFNAFTLKFFSLRLRFTNHLINPTLCNTIFSISSIVYCYYFTGIELEVHIYIYKIKQIKFGKKNSKSRNLVRFFL